MKVRRTDCARELVTAQCGLWGHAVTDSLRWANDGPCATQCTAQVAPSHMRLLVRPLARVKGIYLCVRYKYSRADGVTNDIHSSLNIPSHKHTFAADNVFASESAASNLRPFALSYASALQYD